MLGIISALAFVLPSQPARADQGNAEPKLDRQIKDLISRIDPARIQTTIEKLATFGNRNTCSSNLAPNPGVDNGTKGILAAQDFVAAQFAANKGLKVAFDPFPINRTPPTKPGDPPLTCPTNPNAVTNDVVAWKTGKKHPERLVVIGGHLDSRSFGVADTDPDTSGLIRIAIANTPADLRAGARLPDPDANDGLGGIRVTANAPAGDDAGAQTSLVLEAAHALAGGEFDDTIVFISFSGEEQGLFGSAGAARPGHLHQLIFGNNVPSGAQTVAMLNNDISGGDNLANRGNDFGAFRLYAGGVPRERNSTAEDGTPDNTSPQRGLMRFIATFGVPFVDGFKMREQLREDRPGRSSDQVSFVTSGSGVPAVRFIESHECSSSPVDNSCPASDPNDPGLLTSGRPCPSPFAALRRTAQQHNCLHTNFVCTPGTTPLASCTGTSTIIPATRLCLTDDERAHGVVLNPATPAGASPTHYLNEGCVDATSPNPFHNFQRQHTPNDRPEFPTADYEAKIAGVMSATLASLARAPNPPTFEASGNANAVTLTKITAQADNVNKFVVAARLTTSNFHNKDRVPVVGTSATVTPKQLGIHEGESFFISISAVDDVGHESLFAWPEYRCDAAGCVAPATWNNLATK